MLRHLYKIYLCLPIVALSIWGCECVPGIETPKVIDPSSSTNVLFVHALPDIGTIDIITTYNIYRNINYNDVLFNYKKLADNDNIILQNPTGKVLYRQPLELGKDTYHTFIFYGSGARIRELFLDDAVVLPNPAMSYIRFVHVGLNVGAVKFNLNTESVTGHIPFSSFTDFMMFEPQTADVNVINIANDSTITTFKNASFVPGKKYTVILKGYFEDEAGRKLECKIVETNQ